MPTIEELQAKGIDTNDPLALRTLRDSWIGSHKGTINRIMFICRFLGEDQERRGREWTILNVNNQEIQFRFREEAAYHKPNTINDWLFTRILIVTTGAVTDELFEMRENRVCWMNLSDHDQFDGDHPFNKGKNVFIPGEWMNCLEWLEKRAVQAKHEMDNDMREYEAEKLRQILLIGKRV